jgi:hypothetical protein
LHADRSSAVFPKKIDGILKCLAGPAEASYTFYLRVHIRLVSNLGAYDHKPKRFLERLYFQESGNPVQSVCCAGFELQAWRCKPFAQHLIEWLPEYALPEDELDVTHATFT